MIVAVCLRAAFVQTAIARAPQTAGLPVVLFAPDDQADGAANSLWPDGMTIRHVPGLPGPRSGQADALIFNMPGLASIGAPAPALYEILPGLKITARLPVALIGPQDIGADLWPGDAEILLFLDTPGHEVAILDALEAAGALKQVTQVVARCGQERFFIGGSDRHDILGRLAAGDFVETAADDADPDWPVVTLSLDHRMREIRALRARVEEQSAQLADQTALIAAQSARLADQSARIAAQDAALAAAAERQAAAPPVPSEPPLAAALAETEQALAALQAETAQLRAAVAQHQTAAMDAERKRDQAQSELAFAARVQVMQQQDLRALRDRLEASETERLRQESLLRKLTPKLAEAAGYLRKLQLEPGSAALLAPPGDDAGPARKSGGKKRDGARRTKPDRKAKTSAGS